MPATISTPPRLSRTVYSGLSRLDTSASVEQVPELCFSPTSPESSGRSPLLTPIGLNPLSPLLTGHVFDFDSIISPIDLSNDKKDPPRSTAKRVSRVGASRVSQLPKVKARLRMPGGFSSASRANKAARDRFIPAPRSPTAATRSFYMSKALDKFSSAERLLRQQGIIPDPFAQPQQDRALTLRRIISTRRQPRRMNNTVRSRFSHGLGVLAPRRDSDSRANRQANAGRNWNLNGSFPNPGPIGAVMDGRGGLIGSGTNAPMFTSQFFDFNTPDRDLERHEGRLALALDCDLTSRVNQFGSPSERLASPGARGVRDGENDLMPEIRRPDSIDSQTVWRDNEWVRNGSPHKLGKKAPKEGPRSVPVTPFRYVFPTCLSLQCQLTSPTVLDAPHLRDDFYCSLLAYSHTTHSLVVGLHDKVFIWSEMHGVQPMQQDYDGIAYVTSLAFSSPDGGHAILAIGRADGQLALWSLFDSEARFEAQQPAAIACLCWKSHVTPRMSECPERSTTLVDTEELLAGDESGNVYYYSIEWTSAEIETPGAWRGSMSILARISVHSQQICGLAWSPDGDLFASGGNDNQCCLFEVSKVLGPANKRATNLADEEEFVGDDGVTRRRIIPGRGRTRAITGGEKHKWHHGAAVKAIAFCPWQKSLVATGGGSNDRCIHFYHTRSGACLATINVAAQVTSLIWSVTRREIAATFGYAQPDHPYRIAVFSWPECRQVVAIPWLGEMRALYAIAYPGGPNETGSKSRGTGSGRNGEGSAWGSRTHEEGCLVIASSDESVKFHEVWGETRRGIGSGKGLLGGSDILEGLDGIDKEGGETIR